MSEQPGQERAVEELALQHAWEWFALHARQRMTCVNFFFVAVAFLAAAYVRALTNNRAVAVAIGLVGAWISWWFHRLDDRATALVHAGEDAMSPLQKRLATETGIRELEIVERVNASKKWTSYHEVLLVLHWTTVLAFLLGAGYALYLAGMRLYFLTATCSVSPPAD